MRLRRTHRMTNRSHGDDALDVSHYCRESFAPPRSVVWDFVYRLLDVYRKRCRELSNNIEVNVGPITSELGEAAGRIDFTVASLSHITPCHDHQDLKHLSRKLRKSNLQHFLDFRSRKQICCLRFPENKSTRCSDKALDVYRIVRPTFEFWNGVKD